MSDEIVAATASRVLEGAGCLARLGVALTAFVPPGSSVLLVADPGLKPLGFVGQAQAALSAAGLLPVTFCDFTSDPKEAQIDAAMDAGRAAQVAGVVGLGGGSALDVAKVAAAGLAEGANAAAYSLMAKEPKEALPLACIPTTSGTGSEATRTAVYTLSDGSKVWTWGEGLRAKLVLLDPQLTVGLPRGLTVATAVDAMVHAIESATNRKANTKSDGPALAAIALVREELPKVLENPADLKARAALQRAAYLAGVAIDETGCAIAHGIGHALGALGGVHHGRAVGLALRAALKSNAEAAPERHLAVARALGLSDVAALAGGYDRFLREVGLEIDLSDSGLNPSKLDLLVSEALKPENQPMREVNCRLYDEPELRAIIGELLNPHPIR